MTCGYSREILALFVEDDLPTPEAADRVGRHVLSCSDCRQYCEELQRSQLLIKARFKAAGQEPISSEALASVRRAVMAQIEKVERTRGWAVTLERLIMRGIRRPHYAIAGLAFVAIVSASVLGQMRHSQQELKTAAAEFLGKHTLLRPAYREWVFVGSSLGLGYTRNQGGDMYHNVYIDPASYREYAGTGEFPEGTVLVLETASAEVKNEPGVQGSFEKDLMAMEVSVKDSSRFEGGWGFFDFTDGTGTLKAQANPLPQSAGCLSCHRDRAATDHVFTQFYPVLRKGKAAQL
jgi:hypothetical protein